MKQLFSSLRARLILSFLLLIIMGFGALALIAGDEIETGLQEAYAGNLTTQSGLIVRALKDAPLKDISLQDIDIDVDERRNLLFLLQSLADDFGINITLLDAKGVAWLDSAYGDVKVDLSDEQEVKSAIDGKFVPDLNEKDLMGTVQPFLYIATPLIIDGEVAGYLRLGQPAQKLQDDINDRWSALLLGVGTLGLLAIGLSIWNADALSRPLRQLRQTALKLAQGDLTQRSPVNQPGEIGDLAHTFNHMADAVESMLEEQRAFASNASHELRTPLTTIRLRTEWLLSNELDEETEKKYLVEVDSEVKRLGRLVEDLQTISQADANRLEAGHELVDATRTAQAILREHAESAKVRQIAVKLDAPPDLPPIQANMTHLQIVFRNLLENAIKYTPDGGTVEWSLLVAKETQKRGTQHSQVEDRDQLICRLKDNGIGIQPEEIPNLTKRFYRVDKSHGRQVPGSGLGLSLVQSIVALYGGKLTIESSGLAQGTTALVRWPLGKSKEVEANGPS